MLIQEIATNSATSKSLLQTPSVGTEPPRDQPMKIDFVSNVSCPWCVIGLRGLEEALARLGDVIDVKITLHPFELNPDMPPEGQDIAEHIFEKYGAIREQSAANREQMRARRRSASPLRPRLAAGSTTPSTPTACCTGQASREDSCRSSTHCSRPTSRGARTLGTPKCWSPPPSESASTRWRPETCWRRGASPTISAG